LRRQKKVSKAKAARQTGSKTRYRLTSVNNCGDAMFTSLLLDLAQQGKNLSQATLLLSAQIMLLCCTLLSRHMNLFSKEVMFNVTLFQRY
jgi:hypothetical protein